MRCIPRVPSVLFVMPLTVMTFLGASACGGGGSSSTEIVTEPVTHYEVNNALVGADFAPGAIGYVLASSSTLGLGLSSADDYRVVSETTTPGLRHIRLQQTYLSVPVHDSILVAHADDSTFLGFNGYVTRNLDGFDVTPTLSDADAMAAAQADHAGGVTVAYRDDSSKLVILPGAGGKGARLAYLVKFTNDTTGSVRAARMVYLVDALDGGIVRKYDNNQAVVRQASGPGGSAKKARTWTDELDVEEDGDEFVMDTPRMASLDVSDSDMPFHGTDLANMEDPNGNNSQGHVEITLDMMKYWMGRDSIDDNGFKIVSYANDDDVCGWGPNNACWNGSEIQLGLGASGSFENWAGSLDAVGHEINHGFTEFHSALTYADESGALNESFSDIAGTLAEFYDEGDGADLNLFEDIWSGTAFRYMCDPAMDGSSVGHTGDLGSGVDVHYSSGIPNRAFCLAVGRYRAATGASARAGVRAMGHVWYSANAAYWTSGTTFVQACRGTIDAARALGESQDVVQGLADSWADVGAACESGTSVCNDNGTCDAADGETCASCSDDCGSCAQDCSFWKKAKCKIGIGDCSQCGDDSGCGDGICDGDEDDSNCGQDCGCAALDCEQIAPFGCWCDDVCEEFGDCCADREGLCM